jgi:hypothetical protein
MRAVIPESCLYEDKIQIKLAAAFYYLLAKSLYYKILSRAALCFTGPIL